MPLMCVSEIGHIRFSEMNQSKLTVIIIIGWVGIKLGKVWSEIQSLLIPMHSIVPFVKWHPFSLQLLSLIIYHHWLIYWTKGDPIQCRYASPGLNESARTLCNAYAPQPLILPHCVSLCHWRQRYIDLFGCGVPDNSMMWYITAYVNVICIYWRYVLWI